MNRATAAAVAVAAVLGITGGTWVAVTLGSDDDPVAQPNTPTSSPTETKTRTKKPRDPQTPFSPAQLLYMDGSRVNDGYTHIDVEGFVLSTIDSLVRIRGGWLVLQRDEPDDPGFHASKVDVTGEVTDLGDFTGSWDISLDGDLFVSLGEDGYTVLDLATAEPLDLEVKAPKKATPTAQATFVGPAILTAWLGDDGTRHSVRTEIPSGRSRLVETGTLTGWTATPGGLLLVGKVSNGSVSCLRGGSLARSESWWTACDWTLDEGRPKFSPNGEQLLVVPLDPDGGPPTTYGVLSTGSGKLVGTIEPPRFALDAEWGDNNEVFVLARRSAKDDGRVIYRCQVGGECVLDRPATPVRGLVLGAGV